MIFRRLLAREADGQAPHPAMTLGRRKDRAVDELIGLCRGLLADGVLTSEEARFLKTWVEGNAQFSANYPFNVVYQRLSDALADGVLDDEEERDLIDLCLRLSGNEHVTEPTVQAAAASSSLPLDRPEPTLVFPQATFVVTGVFNYGTRAQVSEAIQSRGGLVRPSVSKKTVYVVVGTLGSEDWMHSTFGRKIEQAANLRTEGHPIAIVSETHWHAHL